jgi:succinate dehydrogenase / fumarate reductase, cytochrome b subunit
MTKPILPIISSIAGICTLLFIVLHLSVNLLIVVDAIAQTQGYYYNSMHYFMQQNSVAYTLEKTFALGFVLHILLANILAFNKIRNKQGSKDMIIMGFLLLLFTVLHVVQFKVKRSIEYVELDGVLTPDIYHFISHFFSTNWLYSLLYMFSGILLGVHLQNGFVSMIDKININGKHRNLVFSTIKISSYSIMLGFLVIPLYFLLFS